MAITAESLYNSIQALTRQMSGYGTRIETLENAAGIYITQASMQTAINNLQSNIDDINNSLTDIETRLQKITLPTDTRYYLEESEITDFRNHFRQLRSMMAELEKSRQAFIRLAARYNMTNSTL